MAGFGAALFFGVPAEFSQPLATFLAGAGVLSAGLLAYFNGQHSRAQTEAHHKIDSRHTKESALRDRYTAIASQIADESAAIRQAGIYALTALADDWHAFGEDDERQVCINLLQWYLRVPFPVGDDPDKPDLSEREIRQTIVAILTERRHRPAEHPKSWVATAVSLNQVSLPNCTLGYDGLADLNLSGADLTGADLSYSDLTRANLSYSDLTRADLVSTNLTRADLIGADLTHADLTHADLTHAGLTHADLTDADLTSADLTHANLTDANLTDADLTGADLSRADLSNANLTRANLTAAKLTRANLTDTQLSGVKYNEFTRWPDGFTPPPLPQP
ncbi:pentapeptide repeat-containing protein [Nocardia sp. NPDC049149]|uniref:pentapeptide repeat-containing protein n=1 Tax=Nocardia sp. NPDC049149 TaxID=3364315 RepID=UPI0037153BBF